MSNTDTEITTVDQIDEALEERIAEHAADWLGAPAERDYEDYLSRLERDLEIDLPTQMDDPVIRRVRRIARDGWDEANRE